MAQASIEEALQGLGALAGVANGKPLHVLCSFPFHPLFFFMIFAIFAIFLDTLLLLFYFSPVFWSRFLCVFCALHPPTPANS